MKISNKTKEFVKSLIKAKIIRPCLSNKEAMKTFEEIINLKNQAEADAINANVGMIYHEYTDWVETYTA